MTHESARHGLTVHEQISELIGVTSKRKGKFTLKAFTKFAKLLNKEVLELLCPPEIKVDIGDINHDTIDVSIESTKAGTGDDAFSLHFLCPELMHYSM